MLENFDIFGLIGGGTLGSIITMVTQKFLNRKSENMDLAEKMSVTFNTVISQLQEIACYDKKCPDRINGSDCEDCKKKPHERRT